MMLIQGLKGEFDGSIRGRSLVKQILKLFYVNDCANVLDNMEWVGLSREYERSSH